MVPAQVLSDGERCADLLNGYRFEDCQGGQAGQAGGGSRAL